jgi:gliding motility-associated-like protein
LVTVTDSIGCTKTGQFTIKRPPVIEAVLDTKTDFNCTSKKITKIYTAIIKGGVPPFKLKWSTGKISGINNETMETDQNGTVVLTVTDTLGCTVINTFETDIPNPGIKEKLVNCNQHSYQFTATVPDEKKQYTYLWNFGDGTTSDLKNPVHFFKSEGIYKVLLSIKDNSNSCMVDYELPVVVEARPKVTIDKKEPKFCEGDSIFIYANGADTYKWTSGKSGDSILIKTTGNYAVIGETKAGCSDTIDFSVLNFEKIQFPLNKDKIEVTPEENKVYFSTANVPYSNYTWDFGDGKFWYSPEVTHDYEINGDGHFDVKLNVVNPFGCVTVDSARIEISRSVPNTFTPNGDGINDLYLKGWKKKIFNRNGILLFEGQDGWDGTFQGKPVANDTYFVVVYDSYSVEGSTPKTNYVTVIR